MLDLNFFLNGLSDRSLMLLSHISFQILAPLWKNLYLVFNKGIRDQPYMWCKHILCLWLFFSDLLYWTLSSIMAKLYTDLSKFIAEFF